MSLGDGGMGTTNDEGLAKELDFHAGAPTFLSVAHGPHYNYRMNELTSAVGIAQLERLPQFIEGLKKNASYYNQAISDCRWLKAQEAPEADSTYHFWVATFEGEKHGIDLSDFKEALKEANLSLSVGYTQMASYKHPVIKEKLAHAFHCKDYPEKIEYPDGLCPIAERVVPRMVLAGTVTPEEKAKENAEKLYQLIEKMGETT